MSEVQRRINRTTGVTRRNVNSQRRRNAYNAFRRKSNGGMGG